MPRFAFEKFPNAEERLTTQMKSVGEVMAMGSTFQESLQKAIRGLETDKSGLNPIIDISSDEARSKIRSELISTGADTQGAMYHYSCCSICDA